MPVDPRIQELIDAPLLGDAGTNLPRRSRRARSCKGYKHAPGTGPEGETCRSCCHSRPDDCSKRQWRCGLVRWPHNKWISLASAACSAWQKATLRNG